MKNAFEQYYDEAVEPGRRERAYAWATAIGLQDVDGLKPSKHLYAVAKRHIEGEITQEDARRIVDEYYETKDGHEYGTKAADSVADLHRRLPIGRQKLPIDIEKLPIQAPTKRHILCLYERFGVDEPFGTAQVVATVGIKDRASRNLIALMREHRLVSEVKGYGKGKVRFA